MGPVAAGPVVDPGGWLPVGEHRFIVAAQALVDVLMYVSRVPEPGGSCIAKRTVTQVGGSFNVAAAAARLGISTYYAGKVGSGPNGSRVQEEFASEGIGLLVPAVAGRDSGFDVGLVEEGGESRYIGSPGVEAEITPQDLDGIKLEAGDLVYLSGYDLAMGRPSAAALGAWVDRLMPEVWCVFDPGPPVAEIPSAIARRVLMRTDLLTLNWREGILLTGESTAEGITASLAKWISPRGVVILRKGASGSWVRDASGLSDVAAFPVVEVLDTTGAGDAHTGALVAWLGRGASLLTAARAANAAAALSVQAVGPATGPTEAELQNILGDD